MTSKLVVNEIAADTGISTITVGDNMSGVTFKTGTSNLHNVGIEIAGINVLGADTSIGAGATIYNSGDVIVGGAVTATAFSGSGASLTDVTATRVTTTDQSSDTTCFPLFVQATTGDLTPHTGTNLAFNSATGALTATSFSGDGSNLTAVNATTLDSIDSSSFLNLGADNAVTNYNNRTQWYSNSAIDSG